MKWSERFSHSKTLVFPKLKKPKCPIEEVWTTKDGLAVKVSEMQESHLLNCIRMLERKGGEAKLKLCLPQSVSEITVTLFPIYYIMVKEMLKRQENATKNVPVQLVLKPAKRRFKLAQNKC